MKIRIFLGIMVVLAIIYAASGIAVGKELLFKDYNAVVVQEFKVPTTVPAPDSSGAQIADDVVYQVRRYSQQYGLFEMVIKEGTTQQVPAGKKVLIIRGEVKEYTRPTVGRRIGRSFIPGGEYTGTAYFAAHYQFVDKATGQVVHETDLRTSSSGSDDTVDYAMQRNAEAAAKLIYSYKR
ncbi:MAG: hypothetical protein A2Y65_03005 [Deltaproteobacteria bacterium RBG_13_52_11]|nr:MAG: hypothetical protein A2Y65_03005 [Deltaproteobacteria bacterium RBG_13_52_11]